MPDIVIVPDSVFGKMAAKDIATSDFVLKGPSPVAGPFSVKTMVANEWIEFVANPTYYRGAPKLAGIIEKKIPDQNTRRLAFEKGEVDYITDGLGPDYERMMKLPGITAKAYGATIQAIWLNYKTGLAAEKNPQTVVFNKPEFRQALAYAIDWDAFKNVATGGNPQLLKSRVCFWTNGISGLGAACDASLNPYKYDLEKAKALIKQAGWDASWEIDFAPYGLTVAPEWEAVQQMWTKAGLKVKVRGMDPATFIAEGYEKGNFDISVLGLGSNANMADFYFRFRTGNYYNSQTCAGCYNLIRYANPEFDKLVTLANTSADPKVYEPAMLKMTQMFNTELPFIIYGQGIAYLMLSPKTDGKTVEIGNAYCWDNPHLWAMK
jgi:peptide/nickel transport system substrate-binding protein